MKLREISHMKRYIPKNKTQTLKFINSYILNTLPERKSLKLPNAPYLFPSVSGFLVKLQAAECVK